MNTMLRQFGDTVRTLRYVPNNMYADLLIAGREAWYMIKQTEHNLLSRGIMPPPVYISLTITFACIVK